MAMAMAINSQGFDNAMGLGRVAVMCSLPAFRDLHVLMDEGVCKEHRKATWYGQPPRIRLRTSSRQTGPQRGFEGRERNALNHILRHFG